MKSLFTLSTILFILGTSLAEKDLCDGKQIVGVQGNLLCNGKPYNDAVITLFNVKPDKNNDKLDQTKPDKDGTFKLVGCDSEKKTTLPMMNVHHSCNMDKAKHNECNQKFSLVIPQQYVVPNQKGATVFNAGILELSRKYPGQKDYCIDK